MCSTRARREEMKVILIVRCMVDEMTEGDGDEMVDDSLITKDTENTSISG